MAAIPFRPMTGLDLAETLSRNEWSRSGVTTLGRYGGAEDIAATVAHLAGDGGRYISGTAVTVDGGFAA